MANEIVVHLVQTRYRRETDKQAEEGDGRESVVECYRVSDVQCVRDEEIDCKTHHCSGESQTCESPYSVTE